MSETKTKSADKVGGYHSGSVDTVISVEEVTRQAEKIAEKDVLSVKGPLYHRTDIGTDSSIQKRIDHMISLRQ